MGKIRIWKLRVNQRQNPSFPWVIEQAGRRRPFFAKSFESAVKQAALMTQPNCFILVGEVI